MNTDQFMLLISMSVLALTASTGKRQSCPVHTMTTTSLKLSYTVQSALGLIFLK